MTRARATADTQDNNGGSVPPFVGAKNVLLNSDFRIWQRGTSFTPTANWANYNADRWTMYCDGSGHTPVVSRQTFTPGTAPVSGYEGAFFWRYSQAAVGSNNLTNWINQRIEDVRTFAGQVVTLSFWGKADASRTVTSEFYQEFGTGGSSGVLTAAGTHNLTTSWTRFSVSVQIPSISGRTIGTNSYLGLQMRLPSGVAQTIDLWGVQLEAGSVATPFTTATGTIQGELAACQRYYYRLGGNAPFQPFALGNGTSSTGAYIGVQFPVSMRVPPTSLDFANVSLQGGEGSNLAITSMTINSAGNLYTWLNPVVASGVTTNRPYFIAANNSTSAFLGFSAEL